MHVGLNLIYLVPGETGGTETYARELIPELVASAPDIRFTAFVSREAAEDTSAPWSTAIDHVTVPVSSRSRVQWVRGEQLELPRFARCARVDVLHSLANTGPAWGGGRRVVTIHDLHSRLVPEAHLGLAGLGMRVLVPLAARRSERVIVDARSTSRELEQLLGLSPDKVDVIPLGLGTRAHAQPRPQAEIRAAVAAGDRSILLCAAAKRPHKNLVRLISALAELPAAERPLLVIPGYSTAHEAELRHHAARLGAEADLALLGWVDPPMLEGLYAAATGFIFPSLHEGFGLPVLEAMARGVPVACSGRGALAEVATGAALLFDPESVTAIAAAIRRLITDGALRTELIAAGRERSGAYSWRRTAELTLGVYRRVAGLAA